MKMWVCPAKEDAFTEREVRASNPPGEWIAVGGSDCSGEDGGAIKGTTTEVEGFGFSATTVVFSVTVDSGTRAALLILLLALRDPKHQ